MAELRDLIREALIRARDAFAHVGGIYIALPEDGDLDDMERERYDGFYAAVRAYVDAAEASLNQPASLDPNAVESALHAFHGTPVKDGDERPAMRNAIAAYLASSLTPVQEWPSACSITVADAVVTAAYNSDEDALAVFQALGNDGLHSSRKIGEDV